MTSEKFKVHNLKNCFFSFQREIANKGYGGLWQSCERCTSKHPKNTLIETNDRLERQPTICRNIKKVTGWEDLKHDN